MILVAAGTQDGRELAGFLLQEGFPVTASVISSYGEQLLRKYQGIQINDRPLDEDGLADYMTRHGIRMLVDASHPYAANVSQNAMAACRRLSVPYIRYERQTSPVSYEKAYCVPDYESAARKASELGKRIFLTTGSRNLHVFSESPYLKDCEVTVRVLPSAEVLSMCEKLGFSPKRIVAMQGPFSEELNRAMFEQYGAEVIVTKNSGRIGGADTKFAAAEALGLPVVLIDRPKLAYEHLAQTFEEVLAFVRENMV